MDRQPEEPSKEERESHELNVALEEPLEEESADLGMKQDDPRSPLYSLAQTFEDMGLSAHQLWVRCDCSP